MFDSNSIRPNFAVSRGRFNPIQCPFNLSFTFTKMYCIKLNVLPCVTFQGIYSQSVWLALVVFGVPLIVISIVCYALCCMDPVDDNADMYNSDDEDDPSPMREAGNST